MVSISFGLVLATLPGFDDSANESMCGQYCLQSLTVFLLNSESASEVETGLRDFKPPFSMKELGIVADQIGLMQELCVARQPKSVTFDSPAILYLPGRGRSEGHFLACIGEASGRLVILNYPFESTLIDKAELIDVYGWRGEMLVVDRVRRGLLLRIYLERQFTSLAWLIVMLSLAPLLFWRICQKRSRISR